MKPPSMLAEDIQERRTSVFWGTIEGQSAAQLADALGITKRSVYRIRSDLRAKGSL